MAELDAKASVATKKTVLFSAVVNIIDVSLQIAQVVF